MKSSTKNAKICRTSALTILSAIAILLATHTASAQSQCVVTNGTKFVNLPKVDGGWDVLDSRTVVLADDFLCTNSGPITDIHLWGSWLSDNVGIISNFWIGIYNDVPAVPGQSPSHPGTNLLWQQWFGPTQFTANVWGTGIESFYNPSTTNFPGSDGTAWYYCFYPTNPFPQQGTAAKPTNYWLAVYAQIDPQATPRYGWKTSVQPYNDAAVWGNWLVTGGLPVGNWTPIYDPTTLQQVDLAFLLTTPTNQTPPAGCVENAIKYVQLPNLFGGLDVWDNGPWVLADDFLCTTSGPITDIHLWGSYLGDQTDTNLTFWLAIYDDVQPGPADPFSHPGSLLWQEQFGPGQYIQTFYGQGVEQFLDPGPPNIQGPDTNVWYFCFYPTNIFTQTGSLQTNKIYWLMVYAQLPAGSTARYGWKTTTDLRHDFSVHAPWPGAPPPVNPGWTPTYEFSGNQNPLDLSFKITTAATNPPPQECGDTNQAKYIQWPNLFGGYDVWDNGPWLLADDFTCTNRGPVSDIHLWGSWLKDSVGAPPSFWLAIYDDVPVSPTNTFSHPGNLKWQQWFGPTDYVLSFWGSGQESFLDPGPPNIMGPDSNVWYYCFFPTNAFIQDGTVANPKTFWLLAYAQSLPTETNFYGWKTTTNVQHDVSVHAPWTGVPPDPGTPWMTNRPASTGGALDLAFKITTKTNCLMPFACAADKTVECGSSWVFDPPIVGHDTCCSTATVSLVTVLTNGLTPCSNVFSAVWSISDCVGNLAFCTQNVSVVDTTPPVLTCVTNKIVQCGSAWSFDSPTASDACCGTNVAVTVFFTFTNASLCPQIITRTWKATDCCNNTNFCSQSVTVVDTIPPLLTCATNKTVQCGTAWTFDPPTATDACCSVTIRFLSSNSIALGPCQTNWFGIWQAMDCCSNSITCTQQVSVVDTTPPTLTCPTNMTVTTCNTNVQVFWSLMATDLCSSVTITSSPPSGTFFLPNTTNTINVQARDACSNIASCSFTVTVHRPVLGSLTINLTNTNTAIVIHWADGILQHSLMVTGTYVDVPGASPPTYITPITNATRFYRMRCNSP